MRAYTDQPIDPADLDRILEAGWRAPSASNRQAWDFVVVGPPVKLKRRPFDEVVHRGQW